ncbi:MAG: glycoside hydrolase family 3 C-terminal domain-containing protein [Kiritimatiellales bacterium]
MKTDVKRRIGIIGLVAAGICVVLALASLTGCKSMKKNSAGACAAVQPSVEASKTVGAEFDPQKPGGLASPFAAGTMNGHQPEVWGLDKGIIDKFEFARTNIYTCTREAAEWRAGYPELPLDIHRLPVPGGRYQGTWYWDTCFMCQTFLAINDQYPVAMDAFSFFCWELDSFGLIDNRIMIPKGEKKRDMDHPRSQMPLFVWLANSLYCVNGDLAFLKKAYDYGNLEMNGFWLNPNRTRPRLDAGTQLNYNDTDNDTYRDKSEIGRQQLSAWEHGWDNSARMDTPTDNWFRVLPVDLNAVLYFNETKLAEWGEILKRNGFPIQQSEIETWQARAANRRARMDQYFYDPARKFYFDYDLDQMKRTDYYSMAPSWLVWSGALDPARNREVADHLLANFINPYNLPPVTLSSNAPSFGRGAGWSFPSSWSPVTFLMAEGFGRYDDLTPTTEILVDKFLQFNGGRAEKYTVNGDPEKTPVLGWGMSTYFNMVQNLKLGFHANMPSHEISLKPFSIVNGMGGRFNIPGHKDVSVTYIKDGTATVGADIVSEENYNLHVRLYFDTNTDISSYPVYVNGTRLKTGEYELVKLNPKRDSGFEGVRLTRMLSPGETLHIRIGETGNAEFAPQNIVDGDLSTKWISDEKTNAWVIIDLGKETSISNVWIYFDSRSPKDYDLLYSSDKSSWASVYQKGMKKSINIFKIVQPIVLKEPVTARYLKIVCVEQEDNRGFGICEVKVNGRMLGDFSLAAAKEKYKNEPMWNAGLSPERRAEDVLKRMTLEEKLHLVRGFGSFYIGGIGRLGIPELYMSDASAGLHLREHLKEGLSKSIAFPSPLALAATWNPESAYTFAQAIGEECRADGTAVLLGPGMNIYRISECGRNFEYVGEDPFLAAHIVAPYVKGVQSTGTMATLKHFLANNMETNRRKSNSVVGERALHEIYLPAFKAGVDAGAGAVMTGYNLVNGEWCGQSEFVINDLLRGQLGFKGLIMSDWRSVYDAEKIYAHGVDLIMPGGDLSADEMELLKSGRITAAQINGKVSHILTAAFRFGLYDHPITDSKFLSNFPAHEQIARKTAAESMVLLKNDHLLPITDNAKNIVVTGDSADQYVSGKGSSKVAGYDHVSLLDGLKRVLGDRVQHIPDATAEQCKNADLVIVNVAIADSESKDRPFTLDEKQEELVKRCVENNPRTVVIMQVGGGMRMTDWIDKAGAVLYAWYGGQYGGDAIADILTGKVNPSGKLPITIEKEFADSPGKDYMSVEGNKNNGKELSGPQVIYNEGIYVGYRWYEKKEIEPLFPFGFGLSYTTFKYSDMKLSGTDPVIVSVRVENTGSVEGAEVVQLYVQDVQASVDRPVKELKGFQKVNLKPGEAKTVSMRLTRADFSFWDEASKAWKAEPGEFTIRVGASSKNTPLSASYTLR